MLHVLSLARLAFAEVCSEGTDDRVAIERAYQENARLREEVRILRATLKSTRPRRRAHYKATERMAILELKAACG